MLARTLHRNFALLRSSACITSLKPQLIDDTKDVTGRRYFQPKGGVEKVVHHKDVVQKHNKSLLEEERMREREEQEESGFSAEKVAAIILDQDKDLQQVMREADVNDMPLAGIPNPYAKPHEKCILCQQNVQLDYKNLRLLSQFLSPHTGQIYGRHITGLCLFMQNRVAKLIKRARYFGFLPHIHKDPNYLKDPKLFDPFKRKY